MKKLLPYSAFVLLFCLVASCTTVKRFKSARYTAEDPTLVDMELFGTRLSPEGSAGDNRDLWDLSAGAQTQLIQILDQRYPDNEQFIRALQNTYPGGGEGGLPDLTRRNLRMVFTISKKRDYTAINSPKERFSPADRIEYLSFSLEIPEKYSLHYTSWNRYVTEYGEIEIADVSFSGNLSLDGETALFTEGGTGSKGSLGRQEEQQVRSRYLRLNGSMGNRTIRVEEEGTREIDLTGNVIADVSMEFKGFPEKVAFPLFMDSGSEGTGSPVLAGFRLMDVLVPQLEEAYDTIWALLKCSYVYRHVQAGWKTYPEWDDRVEYYAGTIQRTVPLFTRHQYLPGFYCIGPGTGREDALKIRGSGDAIYLLQFTSYADASQVLEWLQARTSDTAGRVTAGQYTLYAGDVLLRSEQIREMKMKVYPVY